MNKELASLCKRQVSPAFVAVQGYINEAPLKLHLTLAPLPLLPFLLPMQWDATTLRGKRKSCYMKKQKIYIPYHVNPAVIKGYLSRLPKDQLILHGRYIRMRAWHEVPGSNKRAMFISLYQYCRLLYIEKFR